LPGRLHVARRTRNIRSTSCRHPSDCYSYAHTYTHTHADCDDWCHATDANGDHAQFDSNTYADRNRDAYHWPWPDTDVHADRHEHIAAPYSNADSQSRRVAFGHACATDCNADRDVAADFHAVANRDAIADRNTAADCNTAAAHGNSVGKHLAVGCVVACDAALSSEKLACLCGSLAKAGTLITHHYAQTPI
jgi:hypothetical protein